MSNTDLITIGSGYTNAGNENDGHFDMEKIGINIDNGDTVMFVILRCYNK